MLKIKLARFGKKDQPHYRIVVTEARSKRDGQYAALLGRYVPTEEPKILELDTVAYAQWITKGAQPTETVASLARRLESGTPFPQKAAKLSKKAKAKKVASEQSATEAKKVTTTPEVVASPEVPAEESAPQA